MATQADVNAALAQLEGLANDLSKWFTGIGICFRRLEEPMAQRGMELSAGGAKAAARLGAGISSVITTLQDFYTTSPPGGGFTIYHGTDSVSNGGPDDPVNYSTGVSAPWVTSDTVIAASIAFSPVISDPKSGFFAVTVNTIVPGVSFDFAAYNLAEATPYTSTIKWVALVPP